MADYPTWYEFKRALERATGHRLLNTTWLHVKPSEPLPWTNAQLRSTIVELERPGRQAATAGQLAVANCN
jgi:hypothetical protein